MSKDKGQDQKNQLIQTAAAELVTGASMQLAVTVETSDVVAIGLGEFVTHTQLHLDALAEAKRPLLEEIRQVTAAICEEQKRDTAASEESFLESVRARLSGLEDLSLDSIEASRSSRREPDDQAPYYDMTVSVRIGSYEKKVHGASQSRLIRSRFSGDLRIESSPGQYPVSGELRTLEKRLRELSDQSDRISRQEVELQSAISETSLKRIERQMRAELAKSQLQAAGDPGDKVLSRLRETAMTAANRKAAAVGESIAETTRLLAGPSGGKTKTTK